MSILFDLESNSNGKDGGKGKRRNKRKEREDPEVDRQRELDIHLTVIGYESKLFQDDHTRKWVEGGAHLIPWFGDKERMVDRYDVRLLLDSPKLWGSNSSGKKKEKTQQEIEEEKLCEYERYFDLEHAEEAREKEEEEKRRKMELKGGFHSVAFSYNSEADRGEQNEQIEDQTNKTHTTGLPTEIKTESSNTEDQNLDFLSLPFLQTININNNNNNNNNPTSTLSFKQQIIIENTARFVALNEGINGKIGQALKQKVEYNPTFSFLKPSDPLHKYYLSLISAYPSTTTPSDTTNTTITSPFTETTSTTQSTGPQNVQNVDNNTNTSAQKMASLLVDYSSPPQSPLHSRGLVYYSPPSSPDPNTETTANSINKDSNHNNNNTSTSNTTSNNSSTTVSTTSKDASNNSKSDNDSAIETKDNITSIPSVRSPFTTDSTTENTPKSPQNENMPNTTATTSTTTETCHNNNNNNHNATETPQASTTESSTTDKDKVSTPNTNQIPPGENKKIIEKTANFVHQKGKKNENALIAREEGNTKFLFLLPSSLWHPYYLQKLDEINKNTTKATT
eukprot:TRINITY_DN4765_c0_g1_i1.p1 TRINITY_DN4765_c0_g1~~TRINITY_DN4765_c0_g1_i1.p1  ORF type:complete len:565 (-),score=182.25 TRINITY_DN4765_c0_g1_i1:46-1740(-)